MCPGDHRVMDLPLGPEALCLRGTQDHGLGWGQRGTRDTPRAGRFSGACARGRRVWEAAAGKDPVVEVVLAV